MGHSTRKCSRTDVNGLICSNLVLTGATNFVVEEETGDPDAADSEDLELTNNLEGRTSGVDKATGGRSDQPMNAAVIGAFSPASEMSGREGPIAGQCEPRLCGDSAFVINKVSVDAVSIIVPIEVCGESLQAVVDSGAEVTVMSEDLYMRIPEARRPVLHAADQELVVANKKTRLRELGIVTVNIVLSPLTFDWTVYVAPITDDFLLGCDILDKHDVLVSPRRGLLVQDIWIPCEVR